MRKLNLKIRLREIGKDSESKIEIVFKRYNPVKDVDDNRKRVIGGIYVAFLRRKRKTLIEVVELRCNPSTTYERVRRPKIGTNSGLCMSMMSKLGAVSLTF